MAQSLDDLLQNRLTEIATIECLEPDFIFLLYPKKDLRTVPRYSYVREEYEIDDIYMEMKVFFWNGYLTNHYLSITFERTELEYLKNYLLLIMGKIDDSSSDIREMIDNGMIKKRYADLSQRLFKPPY